MKKVKLLSVFALFVCVCAMVPTIVNASEKDSTAGVSDCFSTMNKDMKVIEMPDGGYLQGEATLIKEDGTRVEYNSETDENAISVEQAREEFNK
ncbi:hypothetical protein [Floccifex sp.]|uniref:hypothetical protein n=1 Tax=Floccifex sp. TaxID=2815810 RepID=UPI002A7528C1|nr:hypothetical protein [Floccifex sp.]MDD7280689.1 hypothetical protein [Erysipelotrichaceae bacterium]MDY2957591.1 hypothetical protein [Floccifex sp.]